MKRFEALKTILEAISREDVVLTSTGMISREAASLDDRPGFFPMIGSMGLLSAVGLGVALASSRRVWILDGDGSALMDLGTMANIAEAKCSNLVHVVLDNGQYQSTGGQPTLSAEVDISRIARVAGYAWTETVDGVTADTVRAVLSCTGPSCLVIKVDGGAERVPRVDVEPADIAVRFRDFLAGSGLGEREGNV